MLPSKIPSSTHLDRSGDISPAYTGAHPTFQSYPAHSRRNKYHQLDRPLINFATNGWKPNTEKFNVSSYYDPLDEEDAAYLVPDDDRWQPPVWLSVLSGFRLTKRARRLLVLFVLIALPIWITWKFFFEPHIRLLKDIEYAFDRQATREMLGIGKMSAHAEILFKNVILLKKLDPKYLPTHALGKHHRGKRLIFVGDVHGCKDELAHLMEKLKFSKDLDHLVLTGDIITKGPDSPGTIELAKQLNASCVRGNWDDRVLVAWAALRRSSVDATEDTDVLSVDKITGDEAKRTDKDRAYMTAMQLNQDQINWLQSCPCILDIGHVDGIGRMVTVHAGLAPDVPLEKQDPYQVMNMRTIDLRTLSPLEGRSGVEWDLMWEKHQNRLSKHEQMTVVYGHDSKRGLNMKKWVMGLDSGCVNGGKLTALIVEGGGKMTLETVKCKMKYKEQTKERINSFDKPEAEEAEKTPIAEKA